MPARIEDYALIGDCHTAGLVGRDGSIDWLCLPRFDSGACFAALLGTHENGRWQIAPKTPVKHVQRRYRKSTLILETEFETDDGTVLLTDFMPLRDELPVLIRIVEGKSGQVPMHMDLVIRCDYGSIIPWVENTGQGIRAIAGPEGLLVRSDVELHGKNLTTVADFTASKGQRIPFILQWYPSHLPQPEPVDPETILRRTEEEWQQWCKKANISNGWHEPVLRSLITLKALTYAPTGGIVAAPTTSLPEQIGGVRNWDYRYCWVRDATFTLYSLLNAGFQEEAEAWREWLLRAAAGKPSELQIMYGIAGERRLTELELKWLPGFENSSPVRIGNAASGQFQLDVYGELIESMYVCRQAGLKPSNPAWNFEVALLEFLQSAWKLPDEGIWEVRGPRRHFTHSKVMAWVALDRALKSAEQFHLEGPIESWRKQRDTIHEEVCNKGFNKNIGSFVQYYGSDQLDASLLMIPLVGFLPPNDVRVRGTLAAIERDLLMAGFVARYIPQANVDGLPEGEGAFLPCTFWLADNLYLQGRHDEAKRIFERLLDLQNDVGLLSEEYDPICKRLVGNFPQAFTHVSLINTARNLAPGPGPADQRLK